MSSLSPVQSYAPTPAPSHRNATSPTATEAKFFQLKSPTISAHPTQKEEIQQREELTPASISAIPTPITAIPTPITEMSAAPIETPFSKSETEVKADSMQEALLQKENSKYSGLLFKSAYINVSEELELTPVGIPDMNNNFSTQLSFEMAINSYIGNRLFQEIKQHFPKFLEALYKNITHTGGIILIGPVATIMISLLAALIKIKLRSKEAITPANTELVRYFNNQNIRKYLSVYFAIQIPDVIAAICEDFGKKEAAQYLTTSFLPGLAPIIKALIGYGFGSLINYFYPKPDLPCQRIEGNLVKEIHIDIKGDYEIV